MSILDSRVEFSSEQYPKNLLNGIVRSKYSGIVAVTNEYPTIEGYALVQCKQYVSIDFYIIEMDSGELKHVTCDSLLRIIADKQINI